jgi:type II secretory pathway pseudopilin PulG
MKMRKKLYEYNINTGHYHRLYEDDDNVTTDVDTANNASKENTETSSDNGTNQSVESNPDIQKINNDLATENKNYESTKQSINSNYNTQKQAQKDLLNAAMTAAGNTAGTGEYDNVETNKDVISIKKKIIDLDLKYAQDINRIELAHATEVNKIENNRLSVLTNMTNEGYDRLPKKYRNVINESNIHQAKIYMKDLVVNDDYHIMKDMNDFKRVFKDSQIVYGKDSTGYFVICIDKEDFKKIYKTLESAGFSRDEILANIMPQILDRTQFVDCDEE